MSGSVSWSRGLQSKQVTNSVLISNSQQPLVCWFTASMNVDTSMLASLDPMYNHSHTLTLKHLTSQSIVTKTGPSPLPDHKSGTVCHPVRDNPHCATRQVDGWSGFNGILSMQVAATSCLKSTLSLRQCFRAAKPRHSVNCFNCTI